MRKFSIKHIAERANVSTATVSYVLNNRMEKVSKKTAEKIRKIVEELDYQPDLTARALCSGKSKMVGLVLPLTVSDQQRISLIGENPFYGEFIDGVESFLSGLGYDVIISGYRQEQDCSDWVRRRGLDGVIFLGNFNKEVLLNLENLGVKVVVVDSDETYDDKFSTIFIDNEAGAYQATKYLISLGHTKIGLAGGGVSNSNINNSREAGYLRALEEAGLEYNEDFRYINNVSLSGGRRIAQTILFQEDRPTAIFAEADTLAVGIISVFVENSMEIPKDLSIVGFDDIALFKYLYPGLTTIRQNVNGKGAAAAELLLNSISNKNKEIKNICMPIELIIRNSTQNKS